jgi:hypothetical protein
MTNITKIQQNANSITTRKKEISGSQLAAVSLEPPPLLYMS